MPETRETLQAQLDYDRTVRGELDSHLAEYQAELRNLLRAVASACDRESAFLADGRDIADAEIDAPYQLLQTKIKLYREAQDSAKGLDASIADAIRTLADDELWKEDTK